MHSKNFADVGIQTTDLWCWKQPLCQLRHNHGPTENNFIKNSTGIKAAISTTAQLLMQFNFLSKWNIQLSQFVDLQFHIN